MAFESVKRWFRRDPNEAAARALFADCVDQAREPALYVQLGVPDMLEGRFEMLALHVFLVVRALRTEGERDPLGQAVFDEMTRSLDANYREEGYGDAKVARLVRGHAEQFYGRALAYEKGVAADDGQLAAALARNAYGNEDADAAALSAYVRRADQGLSDDALREGRADFPDITEDTHAAA